MIYKMHSQSKKMRIVCLINTAAYSRAYFEQLIPHLEMLGYEVHFALDSHLADVLYAKGKVLHNAWYFTDYLRIKIRNGLRPSSTVKHSWAALFSDYDRFFTIGFNPSLGCDDDLRDSDIPNWLDDFFSEIVREINPIAFLYEPVSNSFAYIANEVAKRNKLPFCSLSPSRIPGRIELSMTGALDVSSEIIDLMNSMPDRMPSAESLAIATNYMASIDTQTPDYMKTNGMNITSLSKKYLKINKIRHFLRGVYYTINYPEDCAFAYQHGSPVKISLSLFYRSLKRRLRVKKTYLHFEEPEKSENFFIYPLHYHPEASTSVWAPDFVDELSTIKSIAFRIPTTHKLYVKEHPSAVALQPLEFYNQLRAMPNVRLIGPDYPTKQLIRQSEGVICVTSTVGYEAAILNKPVIVLGNVFYSYFPNVMHIPDFSKLDSGINWMKNYQLLPNAEIQKATAAYVEFTKRGRFDFRATLNDEEAINGVARLVAMRLQKKDDDFLRKHHHNNYS